jgi:uroporphyrinogen decarboxylase
MTSRERIKAILHGEPYDHFGIYDHFWKETKDEWRKAGLPEDTDPGVYFQHDIKDVGAPLDYMPFRGVDDTISETDEWSIKKNGWGSSFKYWKEKTGVPEHIDFDCTSPEKWKKYRDQLSEFDPTRFELDTLRKNWEVANKLDKCNVYCFFGIFEAMRMSMGDICLMESSILEPDWIHDFCRVFTDFTIAQYDYAFREVGKPDAFFLADDLGFSKGLFFSPGSLRELLLPYYKEIVGFLHENGVLAILHACGGITEAVPMIVEAGFDCLQPMEAKAGCNVVEYAKAFGDRIAFMGNMDVTVFNQNNDELTKQEVLGKLNALHEIGARYVFHSDHSLPPDISFKTYSYAVELYRDFCETHRCGL